MQIKEKNRTNRSVGGWVGRGRGKRNELRNRLLVHLENVNDHASSGRELLVTHVTLEVLGLLVLYQHLLILKLTLTVKAPHHVCLLLLLPHRRTRLIDAHTTTHRQPNPKEELSPSYTTTITTSSHQTSQQKNLAPTNLPPQKKTLLPFPTTKTAEKIILTLPPKKKYQKTKKFPTQQPQKKNSRQRTPKMFSESSRTNELQATDSAPCAEIRVPHPNPKNRIPNPVCESIYVYCNITLTEINWYYSKSVKKNLLFAHRA